MDVSLAKVEAVAVHRIGNKMREEGYLLSSREVSLTEKLSDLFLMHYLLPLINGGEACVFDHPSDIQLNEVRHFCSAVIESKTSFIEGSKSLAKHLYDASAHPNIGGGEFIVIKFRGIHIEGRAVDGVGLYRIEAKDEFLDVREESGSIELVGRVGIAISKIQKGALVIPKAEKVLAIDTLGQKTKYWKEDFLQVKAEDTTVVRAKAIGAILKAVSERVDTPTEAVQFIHVLHDELAGAETATISSIKEISGRFLPPSDVTEIVRGIESRVGINFDESSVVPTHELSKYTRDMVRKSRIAEGINLVITKADARVSTIDVRKTSAGIKATIEIRVEEKK
ncbi:nucleoid-associated protein [Janthinobacterium sp. EB271-G4-7A]|uniref:nucleoid-associated protein n=1 Tax=Janthinobacterium sp. EB271-G4-7A TaxID=2775056 RepID=UPI001E5A3BDB|nr:nucleoid-associated protein [Janthinobacterium sp. EB271-G4-7A]MCC7698754.1 nucleoid-associated protein [Janthinobacterium sp. EB271-G4-7A]